MAERRAMLLRAVPVLAVCLGFALLPTEMVESGPPLCLSRLLLDHECWGCGMTRALSCLAHGDFFRAYEFNRGVIVVAPLLLAVAARWVLRGSPRVKVAAPEAPASPVRVGG
jgi:hypothetical protein